MPNTVSLTIDQAELRRLGDQIVQDHLRAGDRAVRAATKDLERSLEAATRSAVPGKLWTAWASRHYENDRTDPAGIVYVKGRDRTRAALTYWSSEGQERGRRGQYLAIPLPTAGPAGRGQSWTPKDWEARRGIKLRFVARPGKAALLVADDAILSGRARTARANTARRSAAGRGSASVPIFVLIKANRFRNTLALEPLLAAAERNLVETFLREANAVGR